MKNKKIYLWLLVFLAFAYGYLAGITLGFGTLEFFAHGVFFILCYCFTAKYYSQSD